MPLYQYRCAKNHAFERYLSLEDYSLPQACEACGLLGVREISAPLLVSAQAECRYDSPIDGTVITTWEQRRDDLARHNCVAYDPEMKTDTERRITEKDTTLDRSLDEHVEKTWANMPTAARRQVASELVDQGMDAHIIRQAP